MLMRVTKALFVLSVAVDLVTSATLPPTIGVLWAIAGLALLYLDRKPA